MSSNIPKKRKGYILAVVLIFIAALSATLLGFYTISYRYLARAKKSVIQELPAVVYKDKSTATYAHGGESIGN